MPDAMDMVKIPVQVEVSGDAAREHLRILSRPDWVEPVAMFLKDHAVRSGACSAAQADRLVICMTEAVTNAIIHGNYELDSSLKDREDDSFDQAVQQRQADPAYASRVVDIRVHRNADGCTWTVTDEGPGFDVSSLLEKLDTTGPDPELLHGRGVAIIRAFVDEVDWAAQGRQIRLTIRADRGAEQRGSARRKYTEYVRLQTPAGKWVCGIGRNLSTTGIALVTADTIEPGETVTAVFDLPTGETVEQSGRVVRCQPIAPPYHDVAMQFDVAIEI